MTVEDETSGLLERVAGGDEQAFEQLYRSNSTLLLTMIVRIVRDRSLGEEVLQEVFTTVWTASERFDATRGSGKAWLVTLARRKAIDCVRSVQAQRNRDQADADMAGPSPAGTDEQAVTKIDAEVTATKLRELPPQQAEAIYLAFYEGMTHAEIAGRLRAPLGTVKSRIRDGMTSLRGKLGGHDERRS